MTEAPEKVTIGFFGHAAKDVVIVGECDQYVSDKPVDYSRADLPPKVKALVWDGFGNNITASAFEVTVFFRITGKPGEWTLMYVGRNCYEYAYFHTQQKAKEGAQDILALRVLCCLEE